MPEIKREVRPIEVNYVCDACGKGMMVQCGPMDPHSGDIEHSCLICDHRQTFQWRPYPRIDHIGVNEKS
ncbi:type II citrate synthase [Haliea sp. E17]|uniref:type II citrate synthase n=1 Tax=Haliea sp. E17 TaxID=3401576 RepID=UPI003AAECCAE